MISRAIVFAHYDSINIVDNYVYNYLKELQKVSNYIVFVSTTKLQNRDINLLNKVCSNVIVRENIGYDFMSYKVGLDSFDYTKYDEVVVCNDSVYGPLFSLSNIFKEMRDNNCDFWGMSSGEEISFHLQSYFLVFKKSVTLFPAFSSFWKNVQVLDNKRKIIEFYEVGLTKKLLTEGFKSSTYASYEPAFIKKVIPKLKRITFYKIIEKTVSVAKGTNILQNFSAINVTHSFWKELILVSKMPFIKIELIRDNPLKEDISDYKEVIKSVSDYDISLIEKHLDRVHE